MPEIGQTKRLIYAIGVGLFAVAMVAGIIQSMRVNGRLPAVDLLMNGSEANIKRLLAQEDYEGAIKELEMKSRIPPADPNTHERLGKLLFRQGRPLEARPHFQELLRLKPKYAEGHCLLGFTHIELNEPVLAEDNFNKAIELNPEMPSGFYGLGVAWGQRGELAHAEKCFAKTAELEPNYPGAQMNLDRVRKELRLAPDRAKKGEPGAAVDRPRG
jgi:Flp pilus assembly protein TadD